MADAARHIWPGLAWPVLLRHPLSERAPRSTLPPGERPASSQANNKSVQEEPTPPSAVSRRDDTDTTATAVKTRLNSLINGLILQKIIRRMRINRGVYPENRPSGRRGGKGGRYSPALETVEVGRGKKTEPWSRKAVKTQRIRTEAVVCFGAVKRPGYSQRCLSMLLAVT